ncbi:hypothetical protein BO86DRAFT_195654 [Aspergillus japonicus CBS 114.51]|uniref:Uncharacterized protein n=1 Tax=Aspergillus japonicus CBS 114.51 TaxID=1448312 RepID=A0A8T8WRM9_ASPJA|nr:hypothetical protein BO86DRAFT_195654 [Aspergillus japonicus CBS 114.51]RAH78202.1 hypothetical protein BO86DRAFT_195654 [Aspergillus japonicus CBS 114.51]
MNERNDLCLCVSICFYTYTFFFFFFIFFLPLVLPSCASCADVSLQTLLTMTLVLGAFFFSRFSSDLNMWQGEALLDAVTSS